jgi:hydroxymethylbilane synthase
VTTLTIGTRGSALALWQAEHVAGRLRELSPGLRVELQIIKTKGDKITDVPLAKVGGKGLFVKELEQALLAGEVDLAVHSIKDLPAELPQGLALTAMPEREDPRDAVVSRAGPLDELPPGAVVGTSSLRRSCQLLNLHPGLRVKTLRGNVDTRLRKLDEGQYDAVLLAAAGLGRLGLAERITELLSPQQMIPAVGQGALGIETRAEDPQVVELVRRLHHGPTATRVTAERAFLERLGGGCQVPLAGHARLQGERLLLDAMVGHPGGQPLLREQDSGPATDPAALGTAVAEHLLKRGGDTILRDVYSSQS